MTSDALIQRLRSSSERAAAAARLCQRAALTDRLDWDSARAGGEPDLSRQIQPLDRLIGARFSSAGWSSMIARLFFDAQEAFDACSDPIACWRWSDVKSKFCSLRAYGSLALRQDSVLERCVKLAQSEGAVFKRGQAPSPEALERLRELLAPHALYIPDNDWLFGAALSATPDGAPDEQAEIAAFEYPQSSLASLDLAVEETRLLVDAAESVSGHLCEGCGAPGPALRQGGWGSSTCESCSQAKLASGWSSSSSPLIFPKAALALAALQLISHQSARDQLALASPCTERANRGDPESVQDALARADELAPLARIALSGIDVNMDLGSGWRLAHYAWPTETLRWLDLAGADWSLPNALGATAQQAQTLANPAWWAERERAALEIVAPAGAPHPRSSL